MQIGNLNNLDYDRMRMDHDLLGQEQFFIQLTAYNSQCRYISDELGYE